MQRRSRGERFVKLAAATAAAMAMAPGAGMALGAGSVYTGGGAGNASQPISGNFSTGFTPTVAAPGSTTLELDFSAGASAYTATNDLGALQVGLVQLGLNANGAGVATITGGSGSSLNFGAGGAINQNGSGVYAISEPIVLGASSGSSPVALTFGGVGTGAETISGGITSANAQANAVTFSGANTITLSGVNSWGGATTLNTGALTLDFSQAASPSNGVINGNGATATALNLSGGTLTLNGASAAVSQNFSGLNLSGGEGFIAFTSAGAGVVLNAGAITRSGAGAVDFGTGGTVNSATANNATGIIGGYATVGGADWAANNGSNVVVAYTGYTAFTGATATTTAGNYLLAASTGTTTLSATDSLNSLKITGSGGTVALGANNLTFAGSSGGLLYAPGATGTNTQTLSGTGSIGAGAGNELIVNVQSGASNTLTISAPVSGGALTKTGGGILALSGTNTYTGATNIDAGTLSIGAAGSLPTGSAVNLNGTGNVTFGFAAATAVANVFSGTGTITQNGAAALTLSGTGSSIGGLNLNIGQNVAVTGSLNTNSIKWTAATASTVSGAISINGGAVIDATVFGNATGASGNPTVSAVLSGAGNLVIRGNGDATDASGGGGGANVTLGGANTFTGTVYINQGLVYPGATDASFGAATNVVVFGGSSTSFAGIVAAGNATYSHPYQLAGFGTLRTYSNDTMTVSGAVTGAGTLTKTDGGAVTFTNAGNTYSGTTSILTGTINANAVGALGVSNVSVNGGTLSQSVANALNGAAQSVSLINGTVNLSQSNSYGGGTTQTGGTLNASAAGSLGAGNVSVTAGTFNVTAANALSGASQQLTIGGTAAVTLAYANTYGGATTVGGTATLNLADTSGSATGTGNVSLGSGTTLTTGTTGTMTGALSGPTSGAVATVAPGGIYANGAAGSTVGTLNASSFTATAFTKLNFDLTTPSTSSDLIDVTTLNGFTVNGAVPVALGETPGQAGTYHLIEFTSSTTPTFTGANFAGPTSVGTNRLSLAYSVDEVGSSNEYYVDAIVSGNAASSYTFVGTSSPAGDDWTKPANYNPPNNGTVPGIAGDSVTIHNGYSGSTYTIDLNGQQHVGSLTFANSGTASYILAAGTGTSPGLYLDTGSSSTSAILTNSNNNNTITAPVTMASSVAFSGAANTTLTLSGLITGGTSSLTLASTNAGTLALTGTAASTYSGGTIINGGTLNVAAGIGGKSLLGTGAVTINAGATLVATGGDSFGSSNGGPTVVNINGGTLTDLGTSNYRVTLPATINLTGGSLLINASNAGDGNGAGGFSDQYGVFNTFASSTTSLIAPTGTGTTGGSLSLQTATNTFTVAAGSVTGGATPGVDLLVSANLVPYTGVTGAVAKAGAGVMELSGTNTFAGAVTVTGGTLIFAGAGSLPANTTNVIQPQGGTISLLNDGNGVNGQNAIATNAANPWSFTANTSETINVGPNTSGNASNTISLGAFNVPNANANTITFTGSSGYLVKIASLGLPGGTGNTTVLVPTSTSLNIAGNVTNNGTGGNGNYDTLQLDGTSTGNIINGVISDAASGVTAGYVRYTPINKTNTSTWTLAGANTYTGTTTVNGGTLILANTLATQDSPLVLTSGTLALRSDTANASFIDKLNAGNTTTNGAITSATVINGNVDIDVDKLSTGASGNTLGISGAVLMGGNTVTFTNNGGATNYNLSLAAVTASSGPTFTNNMVNGTTTLASLTSSAASAQTLTFNGTSATAITAIPGAISQNGTNALALNQAGVGTTSLSGANTFTGLTTISKGTLQLNPSTATSTVIPSANSLTLTGGTLSIQGNVAGAAVTQSLATLTLNATSSSAGIVLNDTGTTTGTSLAVTTFTHTAGDLSLNIANAGVGAFSAANLTNGTVLPYVAVTDSTGTGIGIVQTVNGLNDVVRDTTTTTALTSTSNSSTTDYTTNPSTDTGAGQYSAANGTLTLASGAAHATDSLAITEGGGGTLDLNGTNLSFTANSLVIGGTGGYTITSSVAGGQLGASGAILDINHQTAGAANALTINVPVSGTTGGLTKDGAGTVILAAANTYTGATTVNAGVLQLNAPLGVTPISLTGGTLTQTVANALTGATSLAAAGGTATLSLANNYTGATTITSNGAVQANAAGALGTSAVTITSGTLLLGNGAAAATNTVTNNVANGLTFAPGIATFNVAALAGSGAINLTDTGGTDVTLLVGGANGGGTYTGTFSSTGTSASFIKIGTGTQIVSGSNFLNSTVAITDREGTLQFAPNASNALGSGLITIGATAADTNNATFTLNDGGSTNTYTFANAISVPSGTTGTSELLSASGLFTFSGPVSIAKNFVVLNNNGATSPLTFTGGFKGSGNLTFESTDNSSTIGSSITVSGSPITTSGTITFTEPSVKSLNAGVTDTVSASIGASVTTVTINDTGTTFVPVILSGNNAFTAGTTLTNGTLDINSATALGAASGTFTIAAGTIDNTSGAAITLTNNNPQNWNGNFTFTGTNALNLGTGAVTLGAATTITANSATNALTVGGAIGGSFGLTKAGAGTLILAGAGSAYTTTTISAGTLQIGNSASVGSLGSGAVADSATLAFGNAAANTIANLVSGAGGVTQIGAGATTLTANNLYTGSTTITGGSLLVNGTHGTGATLAGNYSIASPATLGGTGTINLAAGDSVSVASGGYLSPGLGSAPGTLTITAPSTTASAIVSLASGSNFGVFLTHTAASELIVDSGAINLTGANLVLNQDGSLKGGETFTIIDPAGPSSIIGTFADGTSGISDGIGYTLAYNTGSSPETVSLTVNSVPEPASAGLALLAGAGLLARRRRRRA